MFHADLSRAGPGLLLRDLLAKPPPKDITRAAEILRDAEADVVLLQGFDYDAELVALSAFNRLIGGEAREFPYLYSRRPNTGMATRLDLDGDRVIGGPRDAQGYGRFAGEGGMAVLSKLPIGQVIDLSTLLWTDFPGADPPKLPDSAPFPSLQAMVVQRLSTTAHWDLPVQLRDGRWLHLLAFHATPPGFDGAEDRNGRRARDEHRLWQAYLGGRLAQPPPQAPFAVIGTGNLDPERGDGGGSFMEAFLADPLWQDPVQLKGQPTAFWPEPLGALRVSYILPSAGLKILGAGLLPVSPVAAQQREDLSDRAPNFPLAPMAGENLKPKQKPKSNRRAANEAARVLIRHLVWVDLTLD